LKNYIFYIMIIITSIRFINTNYIKHKLFTRPNVRWKTRVESITTTTAQAPQPHQTAYTDFPSIFVYPFDIIMTLWYNVRNNHIRTFLWFKSKICLIETISAIILLWFIIVITVGFFCHKWVIIVNSTVFG